MLWLWAVWINICILFIKKDIDSGILTDAQAIELLENVFIKLDGDTVNICIGVGDVSKEHANRKQIVRPRTGRCDKYLLGIRERCV